MCHKVVPKSYRPEGHPRSTSDEFPSRAVFGNSRQFQYGGLLPVTLRDQAMYNKTSMFCVYLSAYRITYIEKYTELLPMLQASYRL